MGLDPVEKQMWDEMIKHSHHPAEWFVNEESAESEGSTVVTHGRHPPKQDKYRSGWLCRPSTYRGTWLVGFFDPEGIWITFEQFKTSKEAGDRVHYLNGGSELVNIRIAE